jgi:hypothetical protein
VDVFLAKNHSHRQKQNDYNENNLRQIITPSEEVKSLGDCLL